MYKIIGTDQKEYGPITADEVKAWIGERRLNYQTRIRPATGGDWQLLGTLPEFAALFSATSTSPPAMPGPVKTSGLALTSLVLGVLGFLCAVTAPFGLITGIIALTKIRNSQGRLKGSGLAIGGICTSGIFLLMIPIFAAMLLPALARARQRAQTIVCVNHEKQLYVGVIMYASDHSDKCPTPASWCDAIQTYVPNPNTYQCPADAGHSRCAYALNGHLADADPTKVRSPSTTVLIFESDKGWNASGGPESVAQQPRHGRTYVITFCDGTVRQVRAEQLSSLRWDP